MQVTLIINGLKVSYGSHRAIDLESLTLKTNICALLGHNGAGKSTLIKAILGLLPRESGSVQLVDHLGHVLTPTMDMAFCPETGSVFEDITVEEYVRLWCRLRHGDGSYFRFEPRRHIERLEVAPLLKHKGRELSKGQRRRVQTAIGFLTRPKLFLFDEPFDGLDVQKTQELTEVIQEESAETCFLISSHRMDVMERLADHAFVLKNGRVIAHGDIDSTCRTLAGTSAIVTGASNPDSLCRALRSAMPQALVSHLGTQISITAPNIDFETIAELVRREDRNGAALTSGRASLTDAMSYHLRSLRQNVSQSSTI